jgi:hypothetical protein
MKVEEQLNAEVERIKNSGAPPTFGDKFGMALLAAAVLVKAIMLIVVVILMGLLIYACAGIAAS